MPRSKEEAQSDLAEFEQPLRELMNAALRAYINDHLTFRRLYSKRTEASIINDYVKEEARKRLDGHPRVKLIDKLGTLFVCVDGEYTIKAKKLDRNLRARNIPTTAVLGFLKQQPQLAGMPEEPTNLFLGYQRQEIELTTSPIYIVCPNVKAKIWDWPLMEPEPKSQAVMAEDAAPVAPEPLKKRITPKRTDSEEPSEGEAANEKKE